MPMLLYGCVRLMECLRLRVKDIVFDYSQIVVRDGKGQKDRRVMLLQSAIAAVRAQIEVVRKMHENNLAQDDGEVFLPDALARKYRGMDRELVWQWLFPSKCISTEPHCSDPRSDELRSALTR